MDHLVPFPRRRFQSKIAIFFPLTCILCPIWRLPLELGISARVKKLEWWGYRAEKEFWQYLQPSGYNTPTWQTDTGQQQRPRLRIASHGKKEIIMSRGPPIKKLRQSVLSFATSVHHSSTPATTGNYYKVELLHCVAE